MQGGFAGSDGDGGEAEQRGQVGRLRLADGGGDLFPTDRDIDIL